MVLSLPAAYRAALADPVRDRVARLDDDFFNPDFVGEVCAELGVAFRSNGYRWFLPR